MSRVCQLTGKKVLVGNNVSHSNKRTKRKFYPNLQVKKFYIPELDEYITLKISTSALRTINKKGIYQYLKELEKEGTKILK
ncbi:MAG: 50S ribosomal protein L28 [Bacteroidetes bacterium]|nr:50S ribosomal protein L28 [Bacteroidota bacterium]MBT3421533.1 50S ribosomal protein L28 [Bacteroidota bacterium]MBT3801541.1 50S ribosomal protein L28 [Bacteroidota bacterium]MBT3933872.1 50S ribosomal protein L28 [Bacteroidota bacterium]MBT4337014.1 50S ribosomal protein L28 [Bacteroidota bacterium]